MSVNKYHFFKALSLVLLTICSAQAAIVAESEFEFSGVQGQNNWLYGYYSGALDESSFALMTVFNPVNRPNTWVVDDDHFFTGLDSQGGHPNGAPSTRDDVIQYAVRRWIVESTGTFTITGNLSDLDLGYGDNGVIGRIYNGASLLYSQTVSAGDFTGYDYSWTGNLTAGSFVDFVIDPNEANDFFDSTRFTAVIETGSSSIPEPSSLLLLASGCLVALRRSRKAR